MKSHLIILFFSALLFAPSCSGSATKGKESSVREPAVAGSFYPAQRENLRLTVESCLKDALEKELKGNLLGLIVPHAGYAYSGPVAGAAYRQIRDRDIRTVIILGSSHRVALNYPALHREGAFKTPLGLVKIDTELTEKIKKGFPECEYLNEAHKDEHSIEVQLPFLQVALKEGFMIVPILMGRLTEKITARLSEALYQAIRERESILIIASTDLSHYPDWKNAKKTDLETVRLISEYRMNELVKREQAVNESGVENLVTYQCGLGPVVTLLALSQKFRESRAELLKYQNSGDVSWVKERTVGYAAMAITTKDYNQNLKGGPGDGFSLSDEEKKFLLKTARQTLEAYVKDKKTPVVKVPFKKLENDAGAFVTLHEKGELRGCIGYILPVKPLWQTVVENTVNASSKDYRFAPVSASELKDISIEISVLSPPAAIKSHKEIVIGKHGVILKKGPYQSVFLPQVAPEQGWDLETTLKHLSMKAGLGPDDWKKDTEFSVFTAVVFGENRQ